MGRHGIWFVLAALLSPLESVFAQSPPPAKDLKSIESCRAIAEDALRLRCFEDAASKLVAPSANSALLANSNSGWRLVRTPGAKPSGEVVTMMRTADLLRSDAALAGLALHCGESGPEVMVIVVEPFPPRSRPRVEIGEQASERAFEASVLPGGAALLLPAAATALANGPWQTQSELLVKIENAGSTIQGVVPLSGLKEALNQISNSCAAGRP